MISKGNIMSKSLLNVVIIAKMNTSLRFINTLESIINQDYSPINIVVADANEEDSDYSYGLQEDLSAYPDIEYIKLDHSYSTSKIRNMLLDKLDGEYIAFLSANDTWDLSAVRKALNHFEENPEINAVCMNGILIDERKARISEEQLIDIEEARDLPGWLVNNPAKMSAQVIYRIEGVKAAGGFDEDIGVLSDADMLLRLNKINGVYIKPDIMCKCRITDSQPDYEWKLYLDLKKLKMKYLDMLLLSRDLSKKYYLRLIKLAKLNYMWLDYIIYNGMYFSKAPVKSTVNTLKKCGQIIRYISLWIRREISISNDRFRLKYRTISNKSKQEKYVSNKNMEQEETISFTSANQYNGQSSLKYAFNHKIRKIVIPNHVTVIKKGMFYGCKGLETVEIPDSVTKIEAHAFHNCINLRNIKFGKNSRLSIIGDYAFAGCISLEEINLPMVSEIGAYTFTGCTSLKALKFGSGKFFSAGLQKISRYTFAGCRNLSSVEFDNNSLLEVIEDRAFYGCSNLKKLVVTGRVTKIGNYAFAYCGKLESVAIIQIDAVESIGKGAFMFCKKLPYFQLPSDLDRIRARTFYGCMRLKSVKIPKKVLSINHQAFAKCPMLSNALILSGDVMISATAFEKHTKIQFQKSIDTNQYYKTGN